MSNRDQPVPDAASRRLPVPVEGDPPTGPASDEAALAAAVDAELELLGLRTPTGAQ